MENIVPLNKIKEEIDDLEMKQEDISFELTEEQEEEGSLPNESIEEVFIKTEVESYSYNEVKEENIMSNEKIAENKGMEIEKEGEEEAYQSRAVECIYVKAEQVEKEWSEPVRLESDPLAVFPAIETKNEKQSADEEEEDVLTRNANFSMSDDIQSVSKDTWNKNSTLKHYQGRTIDETNDSSLALSHSNVETHSTVNSKDNVYINRPHSNGTKCDYTVQTSSFKHLVGSKKIYKCTECNYCASQSSNLQRHMRVHTGEKPFKCTICDYSTTQSSALKMHIRVHTGDKPFKCSVCSYSASQSSSVKKHEVVHSDKKPFKCTVCDYSASKSNNLHRHMRVHTGEKPYKCTFCDYSATQSSSLKKHIRIHTGERPYKCSVCSYSALLLSKLKAHMKRHMKEKRYKCTNCDYSTSQSRMFKKHVKLHTK